MKVLANETKRILAVLLSVAMIFAYVPNTVSAYADEKTDENAVVDGGETGEIEPEMSYSDVTAQLDVTSETTNYGEVNDDAVTGKVMYALATSGDTPDYIPPDTVVSTKTIRREEPADSVNGYQVLLCVDKGFVFGDKPITSVTYTDYTKKNHGGAGDEVEATLASGSLDPASTSKEYSVEKIADDRLLVTVPSGLLKEVIRVSYFKDYDADDDTAKDYFAQAVINIKAADAKEKISREIPMSKITVQNATTLDQIAPATRTPEWVKSTNSATAWATTDAWALKNLGKYITDKTLEADMIKVTYTEDGKDPVTVDVTGDAIDQYGDPANYVQYDAANNGGQLLICSEWINKYVYGKADISIAIDCSSADQKTKTITVSENNFADIYKKGTETDLDGSTYKITDSKIEFDINVGSTTRTIKEIVVTENNDKTEFKKSKGKITTTGPTNKTYTATLDDLESNKVDDDLTIVVTTQEVVALDTSSSGVAGLVDLDGKALSYAESGAALTFEVLTADPSDEVASIQYSSGANNGTIQADADGLFTIPAGKIVDKLSIKAVASAPLDARKLTPAIGSEYSIYPGRNITAIGAGRDLSDPFVGTTTNTEITDVFYGNGREFLAMWNDIYGTFVDEVGDITAEEDGPFYAITLKLGDDWNGTANNYYGVNAYETGTTTRICWVEPPLPDARVNTGANNVVTLYGTIEELATKLNIAAEGSGTFDMRGIMLNSTTGEPLTDAQVNAAANLGDGAVAFTLDRAAGTFTMATAPSAWTPTTTKAIKGQPFYFTVQPDDTDYTVDAMYRFSATDDWSLATLVGKHDSPNYYIFRTESVPADATAVQVDAAATKGDLIIEPTNNKVDVYPASILSDFDENGKLVWPANEPFDFFVDPVASKNSIEVDAVYWTTTGDEPTDDNLTGNTSTDIQWREDHIVEPDDFGCYTLETNGALADPAAGMTNNGIGLYVYTTETVDESAYTATFALSGDSETYPIIKTVDGKKVMALLYGESTTSTLYESGKDYGYLTATFKTTDRLPQPIGIVNAAVTTEGADGFYPHAYAAIDSSTKNFVQLTNVPSKGVNVIGHRIGKDTITATYSELEPGNTFNNVVYTADLDVDVSSAYDKESLEITSHSVVDGATAIMADKSKTDVAYGNKVIEFTITGTDKRTGEKTTVYSNEEGSGDVMIDWLFDPDDGSDTRSATTKHYKLATTYSQDFDSNTTVYTSMTTNSMSNLHNASWAYVRADQAQATPVTVLANCHVAGVTEAIPLKQSIAIMEEGNYAPFATVTAANSNPKEIGWKSDETSDNDNEYLELAQGGINSLDVSVDMYQRAANETAEAVSDGAELAKVLDDNKYGKVTSNLVFDSEVTYYDPDLGKDVDATDYVQVTNNGGGKFKFTAKKNTDSLPSTVYAQIIAYKTDAKDNRMVIGAVVISIDVQNALAKSSVYLKLDDPTGSFTVGGTKAAPKSIPNQLALDLTKPAYTGKATSLVEPNTTGGYKYDDLVTDVANKFGVGAASDRGIKFVSETVGSSFKLPEQSDFVQGNIGANQVLAYWTDGTTEYYPGETVTVGNTETTYTAVWLPKYQFDSSLADSADDYYGVGLKVYNGNLEVKDDKGKVTGYGDPLAVAAGNKPNVPSTTTAGAIVKGGSIPLVLDMIETVPYNAENKALVKKAYSDTTGTADQKAAAAAAKFAELTFKDKYVTSDDLTVEAGGKNKTVLGVNKGTISASLTAAETLSTDLNITVTWKEGHKDYVTAPFAMSVDADPDYSLTINNAKAKKIQVDQADENTIDVLLKKAEDIVTATNAGDYTYTWTSSDETVATVETVDGKDNVIKKGQITALKPGTATVTLTVKDKKGGTVTGTCEVTVETNGISFIVKDEDGTTVNLENGDLLYAPVGDTSSVYTISASPTVTWSSVKGDGTYVEEAGNAISNKGVITLKGAANKDLSDKGFITATYKKSGSTTTYIKKIKVGTYYPLTLKTEANSDIFITKDGKKVTTDSGKEKSVVVRITSANIEDPEAETIKYTNIDLSSYGAVMEKPEDPQEFTGWLADAEGVATYKKGTIITDKFKNTDKLDGTKALKDGSEIAPVFIRKPINEVTVAQTTVTISNEIDKYLPAGLDNKKAFTLTVSPYDTLDEILLVPDKAKLYQSTKATAPTVGAVGASADPTKAETTLNTEKGYVDLAYGTIHTAAGYDKHVVLDSTTKKRTDHFSIASIPGVSSRAGVLTFDVQSKATGESLEKLTVNINGYDVVDDAYYENGTKVTNDSRSVRGVTWFFNDKGNHVTGDEIITKADGTKIAIVDGELASAGRATIGGDTYIVGANGVLITGWITSTWESTDDPAKGVYYADPENNGKVISNTLKEIGGKTYYFKVDQTKAAASATANLYEKVDNYYVNAAGEVAIGGLFTMNGKQYLANEKGELVTYAMTTGGKITIGGIGYVVDKDTNEAKLDDVLYAPTVKFNWPKDYTKGTEMKVTWEGTVKSKNNGGKTQEIKGDAKVTPSTVSAGNVDAKVEFTAEADLSMFWKDEAMSAKAENKTEKKTYNFKNGSVSGNTGGDVSEDGEAESEPEKSEVAGYNSYNLFYTDAVIPVEGLASDATLGGKAGGFFVNNGDGTVSVKKGASASEIKKAAKPANSLIELTDSEGAVFSYQLPVYYQKPSLKLTSTKATVNKSAYDKTTIHTTVTQKKSNGLYEPVEVDAESDPAEVTFAPGKNKANLELANGDNSGELAITATAKTSGKIVVKKANWAEDVKLSYTVAESSKDVIEGSTKNVILNSTGKSDGEQEVTLTLNGGEDMTGVTATFPKANKWAQAGVEIENVDTSDGNKLTSNELKVKFTEGASHKKGSYTVTFKAPDGKGKFALKITVSNKALSDGVKLTVKSKMDITTGQKMVVVPQLTQVGGPIENVTIETDGNFGCEYNATTNQIIVTAVKPELKAGKYTQSFHVTTAVEEFDVELKNFQVTAKKPGVKVPTITFPKTSLGTAELAGSTNVCATYKQNGKTFSTAPTAVSFPNGTPSNNEKFTADEGWFLDSKTNALVKYDAETGKILVQTVSGSKKGTVKVNFLFKGMDSSKPMKKSFKIAAK